MTFDKKLYTDAVDLLKQLISTPSFSKEENDTAEILMNFFAATWRGACKGWE